MYLRRLQLRGFKTFVQPTDLEFDAGITRTLLQECRENGIPVIERAESAAAEEVAERVAIALGML